MMDSLLLELYPKYEFLVTFYYFKMVFTGITQMVCDEPGLSSDEDSDYKITSSESESDAEESETEGCEFGDISVQTPGKTPKKLPHLALRSKAGTPKTPSRTPRRATKIKDVDMVCVDYTFNEKM